MKTIKGKHLNTTEFLFEKRNLLYFRITQFQRKKVPRIIEKNGRINTFLNHLPNKKFRYLKDLGNTLIAIRWRWVLLSLFLANSIAYVVFAFGWMSVAIYSGDMEKNSTKTMCIVGKRFFLNLLLKDSYCFN